VYERRVRFAALTLLVACGSAPIETDAGDAAMMPIGDAAAMFDAPMNDAKPDAFVPPDIDQIPWVTGASVGFGVASKDTQNPLGNSMFIAYAGYDVDLASAEAWATALYRAELEARGVRRIWAVQGPSDPGYSKLEIGNSKIAAAMIPLVDGNTHFILAAGHSSGAFVAWELFDQLSSGADPMDVTKDKITYFDLDGGGGFGAAAINRLHRAYFVGSKDGSTLSPNHGVMVSLGNTWAAKGGFWENDASQSGCNQGAEWCVHMTLITTKPHDPANSSAKPDYSDFMGRPVCTSWLEAKASDAGL
jgi:hypothetical protein